MAGRVAPSAACRRTRRSGGGRRGGEARWGCGISLDADKGKKRGGERKKQGGEVLISVSCGAVPARINLSSFAASVFIREWREVQ